MARRKLRLPRKKPRRLYSDSTIAETLVLLNKLREPVLVEKQTGIPRGTVSSWGRRYLKEEEFAERIGKFINSDDLT